jgi:aminoglycoside phosphotransferase (APT) family kinase protein
MTLSSRGSAVPFDQYTWDGTVEARPRLTPTQEALVRTAAPGSTGIVAVRPRRRWDGRTAYPLFVRVARPAGETTVLLRVDRFRGGVEAEAAVLPVLGRLGLPVPRLLAGPAADRAHPDRGPVSVLSVLDGTDAQRLAAGASAGELEALGAVVFDGVARLRAVTAAVRAAAPPIPAVTLAAELDAIRARGGPWPAAAAFREALDRLMPAAAAAAAESALVFSNGDYNPANFLAAGGRLAGIVDFAQARFEDPLYGFAKYWTYDLRPYHEAGVIAHGLAAQGVTPAQLALRLAIRCLWTLQREVPVSGGPPGTARYRERLLRLLAQSLAQTA